MDQLVLPNNSDGDNVVLAWDGQVFEVFGATRYFGTSVSRFHVAGPVHVDISDPDRNEYSIVAVRRHKGGSSTGVGFRVGSVDVDAVQAFLAPVQAAIADPGLAATWRLR